MEIKHVTIDAIKLKNFSLWISADYKDKINLKDKSY